MEEYREYFSKQLARYLEKKEMTYSDLANRLGVNKSVVASWKSGARYPRMNTMQRVAEVLGCEISDLIQIKDDADEPKPPRRKTVKIPVLGSIVAGTPREAIEDILDYEEIPESLARTGEFFGLQVTGSSMEPTLREGDVIICKSAQTCDTGDIAVVMINGDEATVKEIKRGMDGVTLIGHNVAVFPPKFYSNREIEELPVRVIGIAYEVRRKFKAYKGECI